MKPESRKRLGLVLAAVFALSMIMGTGPGVLLVNTPQPWLGLPSVCTWGILWYLVQAAVAVLAYLYLWRDSNRTDRPSNDTSR